MVSSRGPEARDKPRLELRRRFVALLLVCALFSLVAGAAHADAGATRSPHPLPSLPQVPKVTLSDPKAADLEELDALLARFVAADKHVRTSAMRELLETSPRLVPAIDKRMNELASSADKNALKDELSRIRKKARNDVRERMKSEGKKGKVVTPDYLEMVLDHARSGDDPKSKTWKQLAQVLAMSRMLVQIGTVEAVRELIDVYVRFGEFLRVDTQLQLEKLGDKAVAALVEARRHKAEKVARWAERQLDTLGKAIVSEAVQTEDQQVLADVLRAYGRIRDPDAARIVISFANSERAQIREAARQSVAMMGEVAAWQLRDTYETIVGKRPPREWTWERTARELFGEYDRLRLAQVYRLFEQGTEAHRAGKLEEMRDAFDKVLARSPLFERRSEMAPGYLAYAEKVADDQPELALDALRRAKRIADDETLTKRIASRQAALEAEGLLERGVADQVLARRALELDADNRRARALLERMERGEVQKKSRLDRWTAAGAIGAVALFAILLLAMRRGGRSEADAEGSPRGEGAPPSAPPPAPEPEAEVTGPDDEARASPRDDAPDGGEPSI